MIVGLRELIEGVRDAIDGPTLVGDEDSTTVGKSVSIPEGPLVGRVVGAFVGGKLLGFNVVGAPVVGNNVVNFPVGAADVGWFDDGRSLVGIPD